MTWPADLLRARTLVEDLVDRSFYAQHNAEALAPGEDPVEHFCRVGWRELRKPRAGFDVWWYWANHLDPAVDTVNPLVHYCLEGHAAGLSARPEPRLPAEIAPAPAPPSSRAFLFAAFDPEGVVDDAALAYLAELARHGDVFVLYDCYVAPAELAKLEGIVAGAWSHRHGAYDFGSYSLLARDYVGWDRLEQYDEVVLVNDSCFLVRPLDDVFATMGRRDVAWWGLQATKGLHSTRSAPTNAFTEPIPMSTVRRDLLAAYEDDSVYDFHIGSYFLALRRAAFTDPVVRRLLDGVTPQASKLLVIQKYEIGLTHLLIGRGHVVDTYVPDLYPLHPLFRESAFALIERGFPLLKRFLITENHYAVPGLDQWPTMLRAVAPDAPVELIATVLDRVAPDDHLRRNAATVRGTDGHVETPRVVRGAAYRKRDEKTAKRPDVWAFAVDPRTHLLPGSSRAIFEAIKDDVAVTKVLLTRARRLDVAGSNVVVEPLMSPSGRELLLKAGQIIVAGRPRRTLGAPVSTEHQHILSVRDGLLWERTGRAALEHSTVDGEAAMAHPEPEASISALLAASDVDALAAVSCTWPAFYADVWRTGLPAHDFLVGSEEGLPADLRRQLAEIRQLLDGRRLVLLSTAMPRPGRSPYAFTDAERDHLRRWAERHDAVLGLREAPGDLDRHYSRELGSLTLDLSPHRFGSVHPLLRIAEAVITDYSSTALDFAVTGRPVAAFTPDLALAQESLLYDADHFFPGPVARSFDELDAALDVLLEAPIAPRHQRIRDLLVDRVDGRSAVRVVDRLRTATAAKVAR